MKRLVAFLVFLVVLAGCVFQGDKLAFEPIAREESSFEGVNPQLFVATSYEETLAFSQYTHLEEALKAVDYQQYLVVCVFLGVNPEGFDIEIKEIIRKERALVLLTVFEEPESEEGPGTVSPFHMIKIRISDIKLEGKVSFLLEDTRGLLRAKVDVEIF